MTATGLAAFAAIGGLWAQAVAAYWGQQLSRQQLEQAEEGQAAQFNAWGEARHGRWRIRLVNRSSDVISSVDVYLRLAGEKAPRYIKFPVGGLPPCGDLSYPVPELRYRTFDEVRAADGTFRKLGPEHRLPDGWNISAHFTDGDGNRWSRSPTQLRQVSSGTRAPDEDLVVGVVLEPRAGHPVKRAEGCEH
ncbi:hypothetical protein [Streptomyces sp. CRN 30]|uniref:hypothetical protein n=1 Tax=Streptomyces sp. CRN 30 TaxID=3075613 RepID=UPI002A841D8E|nr:hypothetical protein [Streptomyces sp. CRN 30]